MPAIEPRIIMHTSEPSGLGHYVSRLVVALTRIGVSAVLFCPSNSEDESDVRSAGVEVVHAAKRDTSRAGLLTRISRNIRFLAQSVGVQLRLISPGDIVHFQGMLHLPLGFAFYFLAKLRGGRVVITAHDPMPHKWRYPKGFRWLEFRMLQFSYHLSDRVIVHNEAGKNLLLRRLDLRNNQIVVIPHGPCSGAAIQIGSYPDFRCLRLLMFGSIRENKGLHLAIQAVQGLTARTANPVRLTIAGRADQAEQQYWEQCKQIIAARPDAFEVIDRYIPDEEIGPLLARHHAVVLPYTQFFSDSGVAAMAFSHSRPILATTAGGLGEMIAQSSAAIPIHSLTPDAVADAILAALDLGPNNLEQIGIEGYNFIWRMRSWESIARKTKDVYSQLMTTLPQSSTLETSPPWSSESRN